MEYERECQIFAAVLLQRLNGHNENARVYSEQDVEPHQLVERLFRDFELLTDEVTGQGSGDLKTALLEVAASAMMYYFRLVIDDHDEEPQAERLIRI